MDLTPVESLAVGSAVAEALRVDAAALAAAIADPSVQDALVGSIRDAFGFAWAAWSERDDVFAYPGAIETASRVCLDAVVSSFGGSAPSSGFVPTWPPGEAERLAIDLERISYRDWRFELDLDGEWVEVTVVAAVDDCHRPGQRFTLSRSAPVRDGDVVDAALRAVLRVHEHEVLEHLRLDGVAVRDPHRPPTGGVGPQKLRSDPP